MIPAENSKRLFDETKLMVIKPPSAGGVTHAKVGDLLQQLRPGDLLIVNRSGTLPSSFKGSVERTGASIEIRLAAFNGKSTSDLSHWRAIVFPDGDWRTPTEERPSAPSLAPGDVIRVAHDLTFLVRDVDPVHPRLLSIAIQSSRLVQRLYENGRPIQYSYLTEDLDVWDQQTPFAGPPISVEPPSASFPLSWNLILQMKRNGVGIASILHGAGLSSTGDPGLDARLPLSEYFEIPSETAWLIAETKRRGGRIVALGTTVVRAVESAFAHSPTVRLKGYTELRLGADSDLRVADSLITGMHEPGTSHSQLMLAFCDCKLIEHAQREADRLKYRSHEYGDLTMLDCKAVEKVGK